jgi:hypothetical protein
MDEEKIREKLNIESKCFGKIRLLSSHYLVFQRKLLKGKYKIAP